MNQLKRKSMIIAAGVVLSTASLFGGTAASAEGTVFAQTKVAAEAKKTKQIKTSRFLHCSVKQYISYVESLDVLDGKELESLKKTETKLHKLYQQREENRNSIQEKEGKENEKLDQEFDQLSDQIDQLLKKNEDLYCKVTESIPDDVYAVNAKGMGITYKEYTKK